MNYKMLLGLALGLGMMGATAAQAQDAKAGESFFKRACAACHTVEAGKNRVGPSLAGVVGRKAGSVDGFAYSPALKGSGLEWNDENLDKYIADPKGTVPGNKMAYAGAKNEADRKNLIAYLNSVK
ncbi:c-type cytochrome [Arenibaculum pallidiluteum]|uniref:c-type cytochrome n=1 Tax=Arenibaculum pallidiluteum TaxID=2812559 RepID=UPI001A960AAA|nr:cytochrome c family protein [Arenibaculum pallidiluteum]